MNVYVLCGGKGTRLGEPVKCLTDINGTPFIEKKIEWLRRDGAKRITLLVGPYVQEFAYLRLPMISDEQTGIPNALRYVPDNTWWTMGDVLMRHRLNEPDSPRMIVKRSGDHPNIAGIYLDCGLYYGKQDFTLVETREATHTINTPQDLEETRAALLR